MDESAKPVWPKYIELKCDHSTHQFDAAKVVNLPVGKYRVKPVKPLPVEPDDTNVGFMAWSPKKVSDGNTEYSGYFTRYNIICAGNGEYRYEIIGKGRKFDTPPEALNAATEHFFECKSEENYVFCIMTQLTSCRGGLTLEINPA